MVCSHFNKEYYPIQFSMINQNKIKYEEKLPGYYYTSVNASNIIYTKRPRLHLQYKMSVKCDLFVCCVF